ncbi:MAG TPA: peptidoglycan DD-metalloendopeptidase family protein [bacterium]|nr:peptidoglycan DD-metalloendopeptidase family protein [bacterium]
MLVAFRDIGRRLPIGRILLFVFILMSFLPVLTMQTLTADTKALEREKKALEKRRRMVKYQLAKKRLEEKGIAYQFQKIDEELEKTGNELNKKSRDLEKARGEETYYQKQLEIATDKFEDFRHQYKGHLVAFYKNGKVAYLEVLFNAASFSDFASRLSYLKILAKNDINILQKLKTLQEDVAQKRKRVEDTRVRIQIDRDSLAQKKEYVQQVHTEKRRALVDIQKDRRLLEQQYAELERENRQIEYELRKARNIGMNMKFSGRFSSPMCGAGVEISSYYGGRRAPTRGASTNHHGIDIRASYGQSVCAAADGIVMQARRRSGYGLTVIIVHSADIATLYGHGLRILVSEGEHVRRGQVIMRADSTGISTGNHLHFEIRENGYAVNPMKYF